MAETDGPLKHSVSQFSTEFAAWLRHADGRQIRLLAIGLAGASASAGQAIQVMLTSG